MMTGVFGARWLRAFVVVSQRFASKARPGKTSWLGGSGVFSEPAVAGA